MNIGDTVKVRDGQFDGEVCTIEEKRPLRISGGFQMTLRRSNGGNLWVRDNQIEREGR